MKTNKILLLVVVCLLSFAALPAFSQKTMEKPLEKWSKEDAIKILNNSPWAQPFQANSLTGVGQTERELAQTANSGGSNPGSTGRVLGIAPIIIRVFSGMPVRQAIVRLQQIQNGYDKMDDKKKAEFNEAVKNIVDCPLCKDYYVIGIAKTVDNTQGVEDGMFQTTKLEELKGNVKLVNDKGEERSLIQITPAHTVSEMAILFFPRKDEKGNELVAPDTKSIKLIFSSDFLNGKNSYGKLLQREFSFNLNKMKIGDKIAF